MIVISPERLLAEQADATYTQAAVQEAWKTAHRMLRAELLRPEVARVLVMVGPSGSGKTTWLAEHPEDPNLVAFDAVFSDRARRVGIAKRIRDAGKLPVAVALVATQSVCIDRNAARPPNRRVPEAALRRAWGELQRWPVGADEGWSQILWVAGERPLGERVRSFPWDR
mgnify:FL=1